MPPGAEAWTLGSLIIVRRSSAWNQRLLAHERVHVRQWRALGVAGFARRYLAAYLRWRAVGYTHMGAYRRIPLEIEAYWETRDVPPGVNPHVPVTPPG